jgi:hypothetical protein
MNNLVKEVVEVAWHRNGISGRGFYAVRFIADVEGLDASTAKLSGLPSGSGVRNAKWLAILTDDPGECYVICTDLLETCGVKFAGGNSWRGDQYEPELRDAIKAMNSSGSVRVGPFGIPTE